MALNTTVGLLSPAGQITRAIGKSGTAYTADVQGVIQVPFASGDIGGFLASGWTLISVTTPTAPGVINNVSAITDPGISNDNTQDYGPGSIWVNTVLLRIWVCVSGATGAAKWSFSGADYADGGANPPNEVTQFGSSTGLLAEEGNINRQVPGVAGAIAPGATGADNVVAVYSLPANAFDGVAGTNRGLTITAAGIFAANGNTKRIKLWWNPATAVVGSTIGGGGSLLADTGAVTTNGGGWEVSGNVFKRGAAGSNTQTTTSNGAVAGGVHVGVVPPLDSVAVESAPILVAVTINNTTAVGDASLVWAEVNAMN